MHFLVGNNYYDVLLGFFLLIDWHFEKMSIFALDNHIIWA